MKERSYEALMAGMRKVPTITDAEEVIRTQPNVKPLYTYDAADNRHSVELIRLLSRSS